MDVSLISSSVTGLPVPQVRYFDSIGSTNDEALSWIAANAADGSLVVADQQTKGRGRLGRRWVTYPGSALAFSLILRPNAEQHAHLSFFSALGSVAVCQALEAIHGLSPEIKWPNDVLLDRKKAAGILVEASWIGDQLQGLVIGIGINISPEAVPPANQLLFPATSVEGAANRKADRVGLLRATLSKIFEWRSKISQDAFRQAWEQRLAFKGEWVKIEEAAWPSGAPAITGQVIGLDETGNLVIRQATGEITPIAVGDVHLRPMD